VTGRYAVTVDIGTSSAKTALWTLDGELVAETTEGYELRRPRPLWAEIDARTWWAALCATIGRVLTTSGVDAVDVAGVGVDGQGWALLAVDRAGTPLRPALIWQDRRAEPEAAELRARSDAAQLVELAANRLDAAYVTPKMLWLQRHERDIFDTAHMFLSPTGFAVHQLTGQFSCDHTQAYGYHLFDTRRHRWDEGAARALGIPLEKMPPLYQSCEVVGCVTDAAARATGLAPGTPVIAGAVDVAAGALGAGVVRPGQTIDQGGQAGGMAMSIDRVVVEPHLILSHHVIPSQYLLQSGTVGGGSLAWFHDLMGQTVGGRAAIHPHEAAGGPFEWMSQRAGEVPPGAHGLLFLPYMAGERSPLWSSNARGVFFGLSYGTTQADVVRAIMEGCVYAVYHNVQFAEGVGASVREWLGIGGAARSDEWCQIKADVTGIPYVLARRRGGGEGGHLLGLAVMVAHAVGACDDMAARMAALLPERKAFRPSQERHAAYRDLFALYRDLSDTLAPRFDRLHEIVEMHSAALMPPAPDWSDRGVRGSEGAESVVD